MNLSEALNAALPEIPRDRLSRKNPPRVDPELITREDVVDGETIIAVYQRSTANLLRLKPTQWQLARLFDGVRNYQEIAVAFVAETGIPLSEEEVRTFAENMDENGFWYKNPQEKNLAMNEKLAAQRSRRVSGRTFNVAHIQFSAWDPDRYLTRLDETIGNFVFSRWITLFAVALFVIEGLVFLAKWNVLGPDISLYYTFSKKTFSDLLEFWLLLMAIGFVHESAHGLTCKHFGGEVHSMGLMFLYLTPCFYVDVTESWISATRMQRLATIIAGIWIEMMLCGVATIIWVSTQPGEWLHEFCYKLILITGVAVVVVNMNPLIKLDGYYFFTEFVRVPDLKERSTSFLMGWLQRHILRLPVDVPVVSRRRVPLLVLYALASGGYSYMLLWFFVRFSYNVFSHWSAELAVVPAAAVAFWIFRSRLRSLKTFTVDFFRTKAAEGVFRPTPLHIGVLLAFLVVLFTPIARDRENAWFVIEPLETHQVHAGVPGRVQAVYVQEGEAVSNGKVLARLQSLNQAGASEEAAAQMAASRSRVVAAQLHHSGLGAALAAQQAAQGNAAIAQEEGAMLTVTAPAPGVIATVDPQNLVSRDVTAGQTLMTLIDPAHLVARLYVPVSGMERIRTGDRVSLQLPSRFGEIYGSLGILDGSAMPLPAGVMDVQGYKGVEAPVFYTTRMPLGRRMEFPIGLSIQPGMSGPAKIFGRRRSVAERALVILGNMLRTHFW